MEALPLSLHDLSYQKELSSMMPLEILFEVNITTTNPDDTVVPLHNRKLYLGTYQVALVYFEYWYV
jgi:hypothetical protein